MVGKLVMVEYNGSHVSMGDIIICVGCRSEIVDHQGLILCDGNITCLCCRSEPTGPCVIITCVCCTSVQGA